MKMRQKLRLVWGTVFVYVACLFLSYWTVANDCFYSDE